MQGCPSSLHKSTQQRPDGTLGLSSALAMKQNTAFGHTETSEQRRDGPGKFPLVPVLSSRSFIGLLQSNKTNELTPKELVFIASHCLSPASPTTHNNRNREEDILSPLFPPLPATDDFETGRKQEVK